MTRVPDSSIPVAASVGSGALEADTPCRRCGYNLRGLQVERLCPECGTPIGLSVQGELLRYASPDWVLTLAKGTSVILWGVLVMILAAILSGVLATMLGAVAGAVPPLLAGLMLVWGTWLLTEPDPGGIGEDQYGTARKFIRVALVVALINSLFESATSMGLVSKSMVVAVVVISSILGLIGLAGHLAQLHYLSKLAIRISDYSVATRLSSRARTLLWGYGIAQGFALFFGTWVLLKSGTFGQGAGAPPSLPGFLIPVLIAVGIAMLVIGIMFLFLLSNLGKAFREEARLARQTWAAPAPPVGVAPPAPVVGA